MYQIFRKGLAIGTLLLSLPTVGQPITAVIKLKERISMQELAQNVQNPSSNHYKRFYEPAEIRSLAGPSDQDYTDLLRGLQAEGFKVVRQSPTHLWISVQAESKVFDSVFSTQIKSLGRNLYQNSLQAVIPVHLSIIESISGLDNTHKRHPKYVPHDGIDSSPGGVQQATIKSAYGFDPIYKAGISGKGQHIAIATYDGFHIAMVQQFYKLSKLSPMPTVDQVTFNGDPVFDENSAVETALDAEFTGMIAPGSNVHVFASASNSDEGELAMFTAILDDNRAKIVNYSWGSCEPTTDAKHMADMDKVFARAVAQGVNIMVASGDSGSDSCQAGDGTATADWPAAQQNVVAVGGTTFSQSAGKLSEKAWSGSGGGISGVWALPQYQANLGGLFKMRSYPDVSFNADPVSGQAVYAEVNGKAGWLTIGGTSMSAPQWSGFLALVGEARSGANKAPVGFINPLIYNMTADSLAATFHDVSTGSNGAFSSNAGWDAVTGFGSMQADALLSALNAL